MTGIVSAGVNSENLQMTVLPLQHQGRRHYMKHLSLNIVTTPSMQIDLILKQLPICHKIRPEPFGNTELLRGMGPTVV